MKTVLITGGAGFIGSHTANELVRSGRQVRILDNLHPQIHGLNASFPDHLDSRVERVWGDVRNTRDLGRALKDVDAVCHFAAHTGVGQSMYDLKEYTDVNVLGTASLIEAIIKRKEPLRRLVLASSRAVYGEGSHHCAEHGVVHPGPRRREDLEAGRFDMFCPQCGEPLTPVATQEDAPLRPGSIYAWTKKEQEDLCRYAADTFKVPVTILRYFNVYGSRQSLKNPYTGVVSIFYSRLAAGQPISIYERGVPLRDFVHVSDVVRANVAALGKDLEPGSTLNVGSGVAASIPEVARELGVACGHDARLVDQGEYRVGDIHSCFADTQRAHRLLGFVPGMDLRAGLCEFAQWAKREEYEDLYQKAVSELSTHGLFGRAERKIA